MHYLCPPNLTPAPLGSAEQRAPLGGILAPLRSREPRNVATSGKRRWIALGVNSLKHVYFFKSRSRGRSKVKYYTFYNGAYWGQTKHYKCFFFLSGRSLDSHSKVLKGPWDGAKQRSGQGQVAKGQLSNMKKHRHAAHVLGHLSKRNSLVIVWKVHLRR